MRVEPFLDIRVR